jgi:hypothetical protein
VTSASESASANTSARVPAGSDSTIAVIAGSAVSSPATSVHAVPAGGVNS